jgi:Oxidoreductase family, NAD-binding Rossmann fold
MDARIGVGIAGSGFVARFHVQSWRGVRDGDITAIYSRNRQAAGELASRCRELRVGEPAVYEDLAAMVRDPAVDAVWVATPNDLRVHTAEIIAEEVRSGRAKLTGVAFEKPLARNLREANAVVAAVKEAKLATDLEMIWEEVLGAQCTILAPASWCWPVPANATDRVSPLACSPIRYTDGYFIVTLEPMLPSIHSMLAPAWATARLVTRL